MWASGMRIRTDVRNPGISETGLAPEGRIDELWNERDEEQSNLRIENVHDQTLAERAGDDVERSRSRQAEKKALRPRIGEQRGPFGHLRTLTASPR